MGQKSHVTGHMSTIIPVPVIGQHRLPDQSVMGPVTNSHSHRSAPVRNTLHTVELTHHGTPYPLRTCLTTKHPTHLGPAPPQNTLLTVDLLHPGIPYSPWTCPTCNTLLTQRKNTLKNVIGRGHKTHTKRTYQLMDWNGFGSIQREKNGWMEGAVCPDLGKKYCISPE